MKEVTIQKIRAGEKRGVGEGKHHSENSRVVNSTVGELILTRETQLYFVHFCTVRWQSSQSEYDELASLFL